MQRRSKKRASLRQERPDVWVNPEIRKLLTPYRVAVEYPEMKSTGIGKAILRAHITALSPEKP